MTSTHLCVGGPLDGQHRTMPVDSISFRVMFQPHPIDLYQLAPRLESFEYQLVWSSEHNRLVWWCGE